MATQWTEPLAWSATGAEPSDDLKTNGFKAGDKPPADVFNYQWNNTSQCLNELQDAVNVVENTLTGKADSDHKHINYATCSTAAATAAKAVTIDGFELKTGAEVTVKFENTNTVAAPTLNVSGTGAYPIIYKNAAISAYPAFGVGALAANRVYEFVFTGANYELVGGLHVDSLAGTNYGYVKSGGDVTISSGVITVNDDSHNHTIENIDGLQDALDNAANSTPITTEGSGEAYTATVDGITELTAGVSFIMIPHVVSTTKQPTLDVNGLGAKGIRRRMSGLATSVQSGYANNWLAKGKPFHVIFDGTYWIVEDLTKPMAGDLYGMISLAQLPSVSANDNGKVLRVINGAWAIVDERAVYVGMNLRGKTISISSADNTYGGTDLTVFAAGDYNIEFTDASGNDYGYYSSSDGEFYDTSEFSTTKTFSEDEDVIVTACDLTHISAIVV